MPFIGQQPLLGTYRLLDSITTSATTTFALTVDGVAYTPASAQNLIVSLNGVTQAPQTAYTVEDSNIVFASALTTSDVIDYIMALGDVLDVGTVSDGTITNAKLQNGAVTASKLSIDGHLVPTANITYDLGSSTNRFRDLYLSGNSIELGGHSIGANTTHVTVNNIGVVNATVSNDLTVGGDFVVNGNTTTIAANELKVEDSLIQLATNNEISDTLDIGFVGHYSNDGGNTALHTGFFRDASDEQYYLFNGYEDAAFDTATPPSTIDRTANTFTLADLNVGGLNATNVGIGASSPASKLDVVQTTNATDVIRLYNSTGGSGSVQGKTYIGIDHWGTGTTYPAVRIGVEEQTVADYDASFVIQTRSNNADIAPTTKLTVSPVGDVGIGNLDPTGDAAGTNYRHLDIQSSATTVGGSIRLSDSADSSVFRIFNSPSIGTRLGTYSVNGLDIYTDSTFRVRFDHLGNVSIGNTNPIAKLHIDNSGAITQTFYADCGNYNDTQTLFEHTGSNTPVPFRITKSGYTGSSKQYGILHLHMNHSTAGGGSNMHFTLLDSASNITEYGGLGAIIEDSTNGSEDGALVFYTTRNSTIREEKMRINSAGNVGVGEFNPIALLEVSSSSTTKSNGGNGKSDYHQLSVGGTNPGTGASGGGQISNGIFHIGKGFANLNLGSFDADGDGTNSMRFWHQSYRGPNTEALHWYWFNGSNFVGAQMNLTTSGDLTIAGTFTESSALRYKENVQDLKYDNIISQLKPKMYNKIGQEKQEVGLIAEDVEALDKNLVTYNDDGQVEGIQYTRLVPHLIAHIQKLEERLAALENG